MLLHAFQPHVLCWNLMQRNFWHKWSELSRSFAYNTHFLKKWLDTPLHFNCKFIFLESYSQLSSNKTTKPILCLGKLILRCDLRHDPKSEIYFQIALNTHHCYFYLIKSFFSFMIALRLNFLFLQSFRETLPSGLP